MAYDCHKCVFFITRPLSLLFHTHKHTRIYTRLIISFYHTLSLSHIRFSHSFGILVAKAIRRVPRDSTLY